jgi:hypothetical protein
MGGTLERRHRRRRREWSVDNAVIADIADSGQMERAGSRRQRLPPYSARTSPIWQIGRFLFSLTAFVGDDGDDGVDDPR